MLAITILCECHPGEWKVKLILVFVLLDNFFQNGSVVMFGRVASYRFVDSQSDGRFNLALSQSQLDSACLYERWVGCLGNFFLSNFISQMSNCRNVLINAFNLWIACNICISMTVCDLEAQFWLDHSDQSDQRFLDKRMGWHQTQTVR